VHSYGVCDSPDFFYDFIDGLLEGVGAGRAALGVGAREMLVAVQAEGAGYAVSQEDELQTVKVGWVGAEGAAQQAREGAPHYSCWLGLAPGCCSNCQLDELQGRQGRKLC
jgi:hypothetical protein